MATAEQVKSLVKAHIENDDEKFRQSFFRLLLMKPEPDMIIPQGS